MDNENKRRFISLMSTIWYLKKRKICPEIWALNMWQISDYHDVILLKASEPFGNDINKKTTVRHIFLCYWDDIRLPQNITPFFFASASYICTEYICQQNFVHWTARLAQQVVLNTQHWRDKKRKSALCVCAHVVGVPGSVKSAALGVEPSPVCIHWSSDSQHNLKGLQGVRGINCSCNLRP